MGRAITLAGVECPHRSDHSRYGYHEAGDEKIMKGDVRFDQLCLTLLEESFGPGTENVIGLDRKLLLCWVYGLSR
jgi:hypothetical protein